MIGLIEKYETQSKTLLEIANHPRSSEVEIQKAMACRRFVRGFIDDLKNYEK